MDNQQIIEYIKKAYDAGVSMGAFLVSGMPQSNRPQSREDFINQFIESNKHEDAKES